jgi:hypothetical protein
MRRSALIVQPAAATAGSIRCVSVLIAPARGILYGIGFAVALADPATHRQSKSQASGWLKRIRAAPQRCDVMKTTLYALSALTLLALSAWTDIPGGRAL